MRLPPCVTVCGLADAGAALRLGRPVTLLSPPGAALSLGIGWWRALVAQAATLAHAPVPDVLDCADAAGHAVTAIREGQRILVLDPSLPAYGRVAALAASLGGAVLPTRPDTLDLSGPRPLRPGALEAWLADDTRDALR